MPQSLSIDAARRIALAAQGFSRPRPQTAGARQFRSLLGRMGVLQIDSVNVFERSHYLPVHARLGAYDPSALDAVTHAGRGTVTEYIGHEATFLPVSSLPLWDWRKESFRARYGGEGSWAAANTGLFDAIRSELAATGPLVARGIEHESNRASRGWWEWSDVKQALELMFRWGDVVSAGRTSTFERRYALPEQVLPDDAIEAGIPRADAVRELTAHAATALGVGTLDDIADYYRLRLADARVAVRELEEEGVLEPVVVRGWEDARGRPLPAWVHVDARRPRSVEADALLTPFDPVVWYRRRTERLFGFRYRIEIYTPAHRRVHGYYVLPVLVDGVLAARVDLKSDRKAGALRVQSAWIEEAAPPETTARLAVLLRDAARWRGLEEITVGGRGTLSAELAAELGARRHETP